MDGVVKLIETLGSTDTDIVIRPRDQQSSHTRHYSPHEGPKKTAQLMNTSYAEHTVLSPEHIEDLKKTYGARW